MTAIAIIPARRGSRRIERKNIRQFFGKPIIAYSIETATKSGLFEQVFVSTEDDEIAGISMDHGAEWLARDEKMSGDAVGTQELMAYHLREFVCRTLDYVCCIYPCAPLLTPEDIHSPKYDLPYVYVPGLYYFGKTESFVNGVPLSEGAKIPFPLGRYVDINTPEDWNKALDMYARYHNLKVDPKEIL